MKRLNQLAKELNVAVTTLIKYCNTLGIKNISPNKNIDEDLEEVIIQMHNGKPFLNTKNDVNIYTSDDLPNDFDNNNPFITEEIRIINDNNLFSNRIEKIILVNNKELKTIFSDFEANTICLGLDNRHASHIARQFFKKNSQSEEDKIDVHTIAMAALNKYGPYTLSFIVSLPPLPIKAFDATQIFSELDKRRTKQEFPLIRITFKNNNNQIEKIQISYFSEKSENGRIRYDNVMLIKNASTGQSLMRVSRNGIIVTEKNAKNIVPVLQMFIRFSKDTKQAILNYGLETGECSICGRELTTKPSIKRGIGPTCARYL